MTSLRELLDELKKLSDAEVDSGKRKGPKITLHPPAEKRAATALVKGGWAFPLPPSFLEFLQASDGAEDLAGLRFLSTDAERQGWLRERIQKGVDSQKINLKAMYEKVDDEVISEWESQPNRFFLGNHPVIAMSELGGSLFFDTRTRDADGEMQLCWNSPTGSGIEKRFPNVRAFLQSALDKARERANAK